MKTLYSALISLLFVGAAAPTAHAQEPVAPPAPEPSAPPVQRSRGVPSQGLELGLVLGYAKAFGKVGGEEPMSAGVPGAIPVILEGGYRFTPNWYAGLSLQYAFARFGGELQDDCDLPGVSCSGSTKKLALSARYRILPEESIVPWVGAGFGYEWLGVEASSAFGEGGRGLHGWQYAHFEAGADTLVASGFTLGLFVNYSMGEYRRVTETANGISQSNDVTPSATHQWLTMGVRGAFMM